MKFAEMIYWNQHSYGKAFRIKRSIIITCGIALCLLTFGTNWLIPFLHKIIKSDIVIRYGGEIL